MKNYIKHWVWFIKESYSFVSPTNKLTFIIDAIPKAFKHAKLMCQWDKMTPEQREHWYVTADRTIEF